MPTDTTGRKAVLKKIKSGELTVDEGMRILAGGDGAAREHVERWLCEIIADEAHIPVTRIRPEEELSSYGFDSVMALNVVRTLEKTYGKLPSTLLFHHQTVRDLAGYLVEEHPRVAGPAPLTGTVPADEPSRTGDIAVVGLSCRLPLADNPTEFWENLVAGRDCITEVPRGRWDYRRYFAAEPGQPGKTYSKWGGFLRDVDTFDASFFNISPREAERMDPQERLFLEEVWHALEDAGLTRAELSGRAVGVYVGVMYAQYQLYQAEELIRGNPLYLDSSYAAVANRVSHFFDFRGPSLALDSMCSSSLTALHLACQALRRGEIEAAVVGGVNLTIHPNKHIDLSQGRYASSDGRCRSFGEGGNGYVPGEGCVAVIVKPLDAALADGDRVHAVIRGTAVGHGGRTNGVSVPNPTEQTRLITRALQDAGVDPHQVGYVEAHGTGTALGDPIEVAALAAALRGTPACAIGSVKSNIGHLEGAAGVAGLVKVVLQLRHRRLVPSLHAERLNPHIAFDGTGLHVQRAVEEWSSRGARIAGLSSFGAGGSNAHVVTEEFVAPSRAVRIPGPHLIVLSARTEERLRVAARQLADHADRHGRQDGWLARAAHTLRRGRDELEARLALFVDGVDELVTKLREFADSGRADGVIAAEVAEDRPRDDVGDLVGHRDLTALAELWTRGAVVPWGELYPEAPERVSLPGYPFLRERHWPELTDGRQGSPQPHPLLGGNVSTFGRQRFVIESSAATPFLHDHVVHGRTILPAAAIVEVALAAGRRSGLTGSLSVEDLVWESPVEPTAREVHIDLRPLDGGAEFTVSGERAHARGRLVRTAERSRRTIDIEALSSACGAPLTAEACYTAFAANGLEYGDSLRTLDHVRPGDGQALGRVVLPGTAAGYEIHPALLDGAFQTLIGLAAGEPRVPFAVERVRILRTPLPGSCWVLARATEGGYDVDLADEEGHVVATIEGLVVRPISAESTVTLRPAWRPAPLSPPASPEPRTILVFDTDGQLTEALAAHHRVIRVLAGSEFRRLGEDCYQIAPTDEEHYARIIEESPFDAIVHAWSCAAEPVSAQALATGFRSLLILARALVNRSPAARTRLVHSRPAGSPAAAAVGAFCKTLATEHPSYSWTTVEAPTRWDEEHVTRLLGELTCWRPGGEEVRYDHETRLARTLVEFEMPRGAGSVLRRNGSYLITGASGGIGRALALYLARSWRARLILASRSAGGEDLVEELERAGGQAVYVAADCATETGARRMVEAARTRFGGLNGVFHLAGCLRDGLIMSKTDADADAVLAPKVWGAYHLDLATKDESLDIFAIFSSASSIMGVAGQADYAYANAFLNHFADWREAERRAGERSGSTVSVSWPLWRSGGMDVDDSAKSWMREHLGWVPLPTETGLTAFESALAAGEAQVAVFHGDRDKIVASLKPFEEFEEPERNPGPSPSAEVDPYALDALRTHLTRLVAAELKLAVDRLDPRARFERLGLESVMAMNITRALEETFGTLPKTLFFEHQSVAGLSRHLAERYPQAVESTFGGAKRPATPKAAPRPATAPARQRPQLDEPIAVVGLSGRYPMADTLEELWDNLKEGRDCITEVPRSRWEHDRYFATEASSPGKSYSKWGGFLRDIDRFDPRFFHISPREARLMAPQERLFLETAWHTVEDAGYTPAALSSKRVGVFVGVMYGQYQLYGAHPVMQKQGFVPPSISASIANRVSYALGLTGPSLALNTMCSSSLTALHLACSAIRLGDCDQAIAGGVNTIPHPNRYLQLSESRFASTDGRCRSFAADGDGYVPGEGVGAVLLKPLSQAEADGDHILAVVRGTAVNHGGHANGFTVPTPAAQAEVIATALRKAGVDPHEIGYVEAHGTGTALGDPIEIEGITRAFTAVGGQLPVASCSIGSVKSNIGHLESAAGIAGVTKVLLQFKYGELVPSIHAERLNPNIRFHDGPFTVQRTREPWPASGNRPRVATVSSFGAGGSNAFVVLEEYVPARALVQDDGDGEPELIVLSARTDEQLRRLAGSLADHLRPGASTVTDDTFPHVVRAAAELLGVPEAEFDLDVEVEDIGLDPIAVTELAERLGISVTGCRTLREIGARTRAHATTMRATAPYWLRDIAFTLRAGRQPQDERLALIARDVGELADELRRFCADEETAGVYRGRAGTEVSPWTELLDGAEGERFIAAIRERGDLGRLARLWVAGVDQAAGPLTEREEGVQRVSLPTYPFARERYWVPEPEETDTEQTTEQTTGERSSRVDEWAAARSAPAEDRPVGRHPGAETEHAAVASASRWDDVRAAIADATAAVLEIPVEEIGLDVPHIDFGVDSVLAVEIVDRINTALGAELKPTDFFNYPTLRQLADHVSRSTGVPVAAGTVVGGAEERTPPAEERTPRAEVAPGDVAVIGMSGTFPHARDLDELWADLAAGRDAVGEIPASRWNAAEHWDPDPQAPGKTYSKWGSTLEGIGRFDPDFFGISPREARLMDPQQRLYLMEAWRALEDAGYADRDLDGSECHAFVGTTMGDYHQLLRSRKVAPEGYTFMGTHPSVLASRISYHLNLRGPSVAVDTSCSSSLMAVHLACEAIREGRCDMALAGGVAALTTPDLHIMASKAGMLSATGRCRPFDDAADGFVPGEGVGVVVLKSLERALRDGDHIHGVIAASGANQDGRTNGITAPSGPSQRELIRSVHERFNIDPGRIGYVECHGTGTRLGDPIEIEALTGAFEGARRGSCAVGSIKSNLGHTLTAAGVAGLMKTLLCLEHRKLVPSLHFTTPNKHIPFERSPFYVNTELRDWESEEGAARMAAVSSFGFSGTNVHVVVREAPATSARPREGSGERCLCPVSAKTPRALRERIVALAAWLREHGDEHEWRDIAYTLCVGRSHFEARAVFAATGPNDLMRQLEAWAPGAAATATGGLTERYLSGAHVDWRSEYAGQPRRRVPLPTYPFAEESYWVPEPPVPDVPVSPEPTVPNGVFRHELSAQDPLVRDHIVDDRPLLPAAGHLSLVHRGLREVLGDDRVTVTRAVWLRPIFVADRQRVDVVVTPTAEPRLYTFEVRSTGADGPQVHSRGEARTGADEQEEVDLDAVRARCTDLVTAADHYARFDGIGVMYGPHFRTVEEIRKNGVEALATLVRRDEGSDLPAGVLDGAIQSVAALHRGEDEAGEQRPYVPFAMDKIRILRPVPVESFAHVRQVKPGECTARIVDRHGRPCVVIDGLSYRRLRSPVRTRLYAPRWRVDDAPAPRVRAGGAKVLIVAPPQDHGLSALLSARHGHDEVRLIPLGAHELGKLPEADRIYFLGGLAATRNDHLSLSALEYAQELGVRALFRLVKALLAGDAAERRVELISVTGDALSVDRERPSCPFAAGLFGLNRSLAKEQPQWQVGCVDVSLDELDGAGADAVADALVAEPGHSEGNEVALRGGRRWTRVLDEIEVPTPARAPFRDGGTYLILGGAGGIGGELALHLARRAGANVALLGRRPQTSQIAQRLEAIERAGGRAAYFQVDAVDDAAMAAAVSAARERFGRIHGAFHSALVLRDARLEDMDERTLDAVLEPKVRGAVVLARALADESPDFVAFFSSAQSFSGNPGQANYAAACTFKDAFAAALSAAGVRTHVINWGYWGELGVVAKATYRRRMHALGVHSISAEEGMRAVETVLASGIPQAVPLKAEPRALRKFGVRTDDIAWDPLSGRALTGEPDGERLLDAHMRLDSLGVDMALRAVQEMGVFHRPGDKRHVSRLMGELSVAPEHRRLWEALIDLLTRSGLLSRDGDVVEATAAVADVAGRDLVLESVRLGEECPEVAPHAELLKTCLNEYPRLLRGEVAPTSVIFPKASTAKVQGIYSGGPLSERLNELVAETVGVYVEAEDRPLNVLEIGAGTGGTTAKVLAVLARYGRRVRYFYTDISFGFLRHGRRTFATDYPFVAFEKLDIEGDVVEQGFRHGQFDVIVAANVLHATKSLRETLGNVASLLADNGRLVLSETTAFSPFATLTFGLLDGWWCWEDAALRVPGSPLADVPTWTRLLAEVGFDRTAALAPLHVRGREIGQHVVVAERRTRARPEPRPTTRSRPSAAVTRPRSAGRDNGEIRRAISECIADTLGRADGDLDPDRPFTEFGVDSIILVELVNTLNARLRTDLKTTALFDHPTLAALTEHICAEKGADPPTDGRDEDDLGDGDMAMLTRLAAGELTVDQVYAELREPA